MGRNNIPKYLFVVRNEKMYADWKTRRFSIEEIGMMYGLGTTQTFDIIKLQENENKNKRANLERPKRRN